MRHDTVKVEDIPQGIRDILKKNTVETKKTVLVDKEEKEVVLKQLKKGLLITGITGSGKTHCLYAIKSVLKNYPASIDSFSTVLPATTSKVENWVDFLFELKEKFGSGNLRTTVDEITKPNYCFLDDLGAENDTNWGQEMLYLVINRIYNKENVLFITTNLTVEELSAKYGDRIVDRLSDICEIVVMPKKNYRE